ncbi:hypothetical protein D6817_03470 [Candidatus Pacearchaeota archaeon]|nr:MAG: hypothetical protein D6817_03470 [Candidatus Pacearchaeota archaeon]
MKKARRIFLTGSVQSITFKNFLVENAKRLGLRGFLREREDGKIELFVEGDGEKVREMSEICKRGDGHVQIRNYEDKEEKFQGFKEFKLVRI